MAMNENAVMWLPIETAPTRVGRRVVLFDGIMRIGTRLAEMDARLQWEADEGGFISATHWLSGIPDKPSRTAPSTAEPKDGGQ